MLRPVETFNVVPSLPARLAPLRELAYNLWWTWNLDAVDLFVRLDRDLWDQTFHNPVRMLGTIRQERLMEAANDDGFMSHLTRVYQAFTRYMSSEDTWFARHADQDLSDVRIAYFSAEYGITECMQTYSGGLGVLAGDHLKSASDLGLPLVGVGLLYQQGYFQQYLNADGWQQESYPANDFYSLPIVREEVDGRPLRVGVEYPGRVVLAEVWRAQIGRVPLYLLNTNLEDNSAEDRAITAQLYGGYEDMRIRQEIMLGIGGLRALRALGLDPTVCHMNEGHSAFLGLERIRTLMEDHNVGFQVGMHVTSAGNVFTTHTSVPAGIDLFPMHLVERYLAEYMRDVGLERDEFVSLGRRQSDGDSFSMAVLALRLADHTNGVSGAHAEVAREMWHDLWPQVPVDEVPITPITNGIHIRSFLSNDMAGLFLRYLGPRWIERPWDHSVWQRVDRIPDEELWRTHERRRERLVSVARNRLYRYLRRRGAPAHELEKAHDVLDPEVLTIGFARRFATYKRASLLFADPERLARILNDPERPVQIIFSGKAHPHDNPGKELVRQIVHWARQPEFRQRIIFLEDYDLALARYLVQGCDVWLNTPRPGMEASGTSGMKAAVNGALNCSTFDGWWCEGYSPEIGWRIGMGERYADESHGDAVEAQALYDILEQDIVPRFYDTGSNGLPRRWIAMMKASIREVAPRFNTHRMLEDYCHTLYFPAARRFRQLSSEGSQRGVALSEWFDHVRGSWHQLRIVAVESNVDRSLPITVPIEVRADIALGALSPDDLSVTIYHGPVGPDGRLHRHEVAHMEPGEIGPDGICRFEGSFRSSRSGLHGYTIRISPRHPDLSGSHVAELALWSNGAP